MALPPEPLDDILPQAQLGVVATITKIVQRDEQTSFAQSDDPQAVDIPRDLPAQRLLLSIKETLFGTTPSNEIEVLKPAGDYVLREGIEGNFLLQLKGQATPQILGRYGPDTYSSQALRAAIKAHQR